MVRTLAALSVFAATLFAQGRVSPENFGERILCIVPMIGDGTPANPRRPMFAPTPADLKGMAPLPLQSNAETRQANGALPPIPLAPPPPSGILGFGYQLSDDGNYALVEFVGINRAVLSPMLKSTDSRVKVFDRKAAKASDIETEFQKYKKNFSLANFHFVRFM